MAIVLVAAGLAGLQQTRTQKSVEPPAPVLGEESSYTFRDPPVNSEGVKSLADLRGRPVVLEFWGTT